MPSGRIVRLSGSKSVGRAVLWNRFRLAGACLAVLLPSTFLAAQAQPNDPVPAAAAQQPAQPAQSATPQRGQPPTSQSATSQPAQPAKRPVRPHASLDDQVKTFAKSLDLNEAQQAAVKTILEQRQKEILRLRSDGSISGSDRIGRLRALQDQTVERIRSVLNDEQKKKYNPLAVRQVPPAPDQKSVGDWMKATTPHQ